jgi:hypothetical protein
LAAPALEPVRREVPAARDASRVPPALHSEQPSAVDPSTPTIDTGSDYLMHDLELRTFQLDDRDRAEETPRRGVFRRIALAAVFAGLVLAVALYFTPRGRPYYLRWYQQVIAWVNSVKGRPAGAPPAADDGNSQNTASRSNKPSVTTPTPLWSVPRSDPSSTAALAVAPSGKDSPVSQPAVKGEAPKSEVHIGPGSSPGAANTKPALESVAVEGPAASPTEPRAAEQRAWELRERAINSEQRGDYANALKEYEWIEQLRLPEGAGPTDIDSRLRHVRELLKQRTNQSDAR